MRDILVIVDPIKGGAEMLEAARARHTDVRVIFTLDAETLRDLAVPEAEISAALLTVDPAIVCLWLGEDQARVAAVLPASEPGTAFTIRLAQLLGLPNIASTNPDRFRSKKAMRDHAKNRGVAIPHYAELLPNDDIVLFDASAPHILKPVDAAGSDAVTIIHSAEEASNHIATHTRNLFGQPINRWLLEEYVHGAEYAINTVSCGGRHAVIDIWEYCQPTDVRQRVYNHPYWNVLQLESGAEFDAIADYAADLLTRFDVTFGFCHIEAKRNPITGKLVLIEIAWRLAGADFPHAWEHLLGVDIYHDLDRLYGGEQVVLSQYLPDTEAGHVGVVFIQSAKDGVLLQLSGREEVERMEGVYRVTGAKPGQLVSCTLDLQSDVARAMIWAPSRAGLVSLAARIRATLVPEVLPLGSKMPSARL